MKLKLGQMLQIKSHLNEERCRCNHHRAYWSTICSMMTTPASVFVNARDPKILCSTRIKSKRNSSRLHMHREAKNCDLSLENVADENVAFESSSAVIQTGWDKPVEGLQPDVRLPQHVPVQKILSSLRMARTIRSKNTIVIFSKGSPELSVPITIANFSNRDVIRSLKKKKLISRSS